MGSEAILNVCGDFHYGVRGVESSEIESSLNEVTDQHKGNIFRIFTGDIIENALKTSVGHNYDIAIPDPDIQKRDMIEVLTKTTKRLYGEQTWKKASLNKLNGIRAIGVDGNHEYRSRKLTGQWLARDIYEPAKILYGGMSAIIELTIENKKLRMQKKYNIFVAHRPSKTSATSLESILRAFKRKQSTLPGIDIIIFGHYHKRYIQADGYFDSKEERFKKVLYIINPSPMIDAEYAEEAGYPPLVIGHHISCFLPLDKKLEPWGII